MATTAVFLPAKFQGWRSVADCSSWGHKRVGNDLVTKQQQTLPVSSISVSQFELLINTQVHKNIQLWKSQYSYRYYFLLINHLNTWQPVLLLLLLLSNIHYAHNCQRDLLQKRKKEKIRTCNYFLVNLHFT